eukprot:GEMP01030492.1.p1 GENE.GEMP01030492.1~~GEMP01030492.1.p1  ORF type:complete len:404 (+),score=73.37 GEMP01030492.1:58-1269(+)
MFAHWRWGVFPCDSKDLLSGFYRVNGGVVHALVWLKDQLYRLSEESSIAGGVHEEKIMCDSDGDSLTVVKSLLVAEDGGAFLAPSGTTVSLCRVTKTYRLHFAWSARCCCWSGDEICLATSASLEFREAKEGTVLRTISLSFFPTCIAPVLVGVAAGGKGHLAVLRDVKLTEMDLPGYNCLQIQATHGRLLVEAEVEPPLEQTSSIQLPGGQKLTCVEPTSILTLREKVIVPIATEKMEKGPPLPHGVYHLEGNDVYFAHWENGHIVVSQHVFLPAHRWQDSALQFVKQITEPDCSRNSPRVVGIRVRPKTKHGKAVCGSSPRLSRPKARPSPSANSASWMSTRFVFPRNHVIAQNSPPPTSYVSYKLPFRQHTHREKTGRPTGQSCAHYSYRQQRHRHLGRH